METVLKNYTRIALELKCKKATILHYPKTPSLQTTKCALTDGFNLCQPCQTMNKYYRACRANAVFSKLQGLMFPQGQLLLVSIGVSLEKQYNYWVELLLDGAGTVHSIFTLKNEMVSKLQTLFLASFLQINFCALKGRS